MILVHLYALKTLLLFIYCQQAKNLGIIYKISLTCNNNYTDDDRVVFLLRANFSLPQNITDDNIECEVLVSIDGIRNISICLSKKFVMLLSYIHGLHRKITNTISPYYFNLQFIPIFLLTNEFYSFSIQWKSQIFVLNFVYSLNGVWHGFFTIISSRSATNYNPQQK